MSGMGKPKHHGGSDLRGGLRGGATPKLGLEREEFGMVSHKMCH